MISADRITELAHQINDTKREENAKFWATRAKEEAKEKELEKQAEADFLDHRAEFLEEAKAQHAARFQPLEEILDNFKGPLAAIRDQYYPGSRIVVADSYRHLYPHKSAEYSQTLLVLKEPLTDRKIKGKEALAIHALAEEHTRKPFLGIVRKPSIKYGVYINEQFSENSEGWQLLLSRMRKTTADFQQVRKPEELFLLKDFHPRFFRSLGQLTYADPFSLNLNSYEKEEIIPAGNKQKLMRTAETRLAEVIARDSI